MTIVQSVAGFQREPAGVRPLVFRASPPARRIAVREKETRDDAELVTAQLWYETMKDSADNTVSSTNIDTLNSFLASRLSEVSEVEFIFSKFQDSVFYVWVIINEFDRRVRRRIYEKEKELIKIFPEFDFDYYVLARLNRDVGGLVSDDVDRVYPRG